MIPTALLCCNIYKRSHPNIKTVLVPSTNDFPCFYRELFDATLYFSLEDETPESAVIYRNNYMVDHCNVFITNFHRNDGCEFQLCKRALNAEKYFGTNNAEVYTMDITPYSYQQEILDKLEAERKVRGYYRNLVVAATGTGKTVISALDYKRFRKQNPDKPCRLLFVAHREEILKQSLYTFRAVLIAALIIAAI